jgi:hypothetical protein
VRAAESTYVKVRCEGDRGRPIYAAAAKAGEADAAVFEDAVYVFVVLHSDAQALIKVRDRKENRFYGQVCAPSFLIRPRMRHPCLLALLPGTCMPCLCSLSGA